MSELPISRRFVHASILGLVFPCFLIVVSAIFAFRSQRQLADSFHWVSHTIEVRREIERTLSLIVDAETGARGFLLSSREEYLDPYWATLKQFPAEQEVLRQLTSDNPRQQAMLRQLDPIIANKFSLLARGIALQRAGDRQAILALIGTNEGREAMDAIRARYDLMEKEEIRLLGGRQEMLTARAHFNVIILWTLVGLNVLFAASMLFALRRLLRVQGLVTVCAWSRTVQFQGEWLSFEEYLARRFGLNVSHGISPTEASRAFEQLH